MAGMLNRMVRAARLDSRLYEEVEADRGALGQAIGVVVLGSIASGVGNGGLIGVTAIAGWRDQGAGRLGASGRP